MLADQLLDFFSVRHLYQQLKGYIAKDSSIVHSSGNETIAGTKTFSSTIVGSVNGTAAGLSANSGVTAGSYGPSTDASPEAGGTITVPQVTVDEKGLITGAANRTITFPSGGGSEEQFEKVYETTLAEAAEDVTITAENTSGTYVDMVCYILFADSGASRTVSCDAYADSNGSVYIGGVQLAIDAPACTISIESKGGLLYSSAFGLIRSGDTPSYVSVSGYSCPAPMNGGPYPATEKSGIAMLLLAVSGEIFSAGTTITVYARKKVADPEPEA